MKSTISPDCRHDAEQRHVLWLRQPPPTSPAQATFPYPLYAKMGGNLQGQERRGHELPVDRFGWRHQAIQAKTVDFGASDKPLTLEELKGRPDPVPGGDGRRGAGGQPAGRGARPAEKSPARCWLTSPGQVTKWNDPAITSINLA